MSATQQFIDYVRTDSELRRAYLGMLTEVLDIQIHQAATSAHTWEAVLHVRGGIDLLNQLRNMIQMEEREHAARRDYDERTGRPGR